MLVNGKWEEKFDPVQARDKVGRFIRKPSSFRNWITPDGKAGPTGTGGFKAEAGRYHLYVAMICPWACRTLMMRKLKKLEDVISVSVLEPFLTDQGWKFGTYPGCQNDPFSDATYLHELYTHARSDYTGRATVPVLWDKKNKTIVNNESAEIVQMLNSAFNEFGDETVNIYPGPLRDQIDELNDLLYDNFNNGVYKSGFATTQVAYEEAVGNVFGTLDKMEALLSDGRAFLLGDKLTEPDIRIFVTLVRFDVAYHGLFKCNIRRIADYPNLIRLIRRIIAIPGISETVNLDHIKAGYYSIESLNPRKLVPVGPGNDELGFDAIPTSSAA